MIVRNGIYFFVALLLVGGMFYDSVAQNAFTGAHAAGEKPKLVPLVKTDDIVKQIRAGKKVLFVDARENEEFEEAHIPGARVMTLREVETANLDAYRSADLVVAYCVKDFRGFEVARALQRRGVTKISLIESHGLHGWKKASLPLAGMQTELTDEQALHQVKYCSKGNCGEGKNAS